VRVAPPVVLTPAERAQLLTWSRGRSAPHRLVDRSRIVLAAADGKTNKQIVEELSLHPRTVALWRRRFLLLRLAGIEHDAPRPGRKPRLDPEFVKGVVFKTLHTKPRGETHWSLRTLAREVHAHRSTIHRIWQRYGIRPHLTRSFKLSHDPRFEEKLVDVVGLYMNPPERSVIFSVDEKPQTQALERTQAVLPMDGNWPEGRPHDYRRHGTIDLYAALNILDGKVITDFQPTHGHEEFLAFLRLIDHQVPSELKVHVVLDNLSAHKTPEVKRWLLRHPRYTFHFVPTGSSWMNMVEGWLSQLQKKALARGSFRSVAELRCAILDFVEASNGHAKPWIWTKDAKTILRKVQKIRRRLQAPLTERIEPRIKAHPLETPHSSERGPAD
jgi:transposase